MSSVRLDHKRALGALAKPTLRMLGHPKASYVIAIFSTLLPADQQRIAAETFHAKVDARLDELRIDDPDAPTQGAREFATRWVKQQWLSRAPNDVGEEGYSLTSHAQEAIEFCARMSGRRAVLSADVMCAGVSASRTTATPVSRGGTIEICRQSATEPAAPRTATCSRCWPRRVEQTHDMGDYDPVIGASALTCLWQAGTGRASTGSVLSPARAARV